MNTFYHNKINKHTVEILETHPQREIGVRYSFYVEPNNSNSFVFNVCNDFLPNLRVNTDFILAQIINELNPFTSLREMYDYLNMKQNIKIGDYYFYIECVGQKPFE